MRHPASVVDAPGRHHLRAAEISIRIPVASADWQYRYRTSHFHPIAERDGTASHREWRDVFF